ncbi:MAG: hypothetical protein ACFFER_16400 [Candidatus Thorarchaeota archaeon]
MVNKEKAAKRDLIRVRKSQNPQQIDFRRMRKQRKARSEFWAFKKKPSAHVVKEMKEKAKPKKMAPRRRMKPELEVIDEEPELEVIEDEPVLEEFEDEPVLAVLKEEPELEALEDEEEEPELEVIDEELEDLYSYDDDILDDDELEELDE